MNFQLQMTLLLCATGFFIFVINMVRNYKLDLRYSLTWIVSAILFILLAIFPGMIKGIARMLGIKEPVNALFLVVIFFLLLITLTLTIALSKKSNSIKNLVQEVGILKLKVEALVKNK